MITSKIDGLFKRTSTHLVDSPSLEFNQVSFAFSEQVVLDNISLTISKGDRVAVIGPNGAGKSTLFKIISGILKPTSGSLNIFGAAPLKHICVAYLPQRSQVDWHFPVTVRDVVLMGRIKKIGWLRHPGKKDFAIADNCLEAVKLSDLSNRQISELSGGQQQRMFIARALAQEAEVILMDEPLNGLDKPSQDIIFQLLDELRNANTTVLVAMHDLDLAAERFDRVMLLNRSLIGYGFARAVFAQENLVQAYGSHLHIIPSENGFVALSDTCCDQD